MLSTTSDRWHYPLLLIFVVMLTPMSNNHNHISVYWYRLCPDFFLYTTKIEMNEQVAIKLTEQIHVSQKMNPFQDLSCAVCKLL